MFRATNCFLFIMVVVVLGSGGCLREKMQSNESPGEQVAETHGDHRLKFDKGIGFYWAADGVTHFLNWTENPTGRPNEWSIINVPVHARFFFYGLDFSQTSYMGHPLPPHVLGFGFSFRDPATGKYRGRWPIHLIPIKGYDEPVYEARLSLPGLVTYHKAEQWALEIGHPHGQIAHIFRFATEEYEKQQEALREFMLGVLSDSSKWYEGSLTIRNLIFDPQEIPVQVRFTSFDRESRRVTAELKGLEEDVTSLTGEWPNPRRLVLRNPQAGVDWDLDLYGESLSGIQSGNIGYSEVILNLQKESSSG